MNSLQQRRNDTGVPDMSLAHVTPCVPASLVESCLCRVADHVEDIGLNSLQGIDSSLLPIDVLQCLYIVTAV